MHNKKKCKLCKYHGTVTGRAGRPDPNVMQNIVCGYSLLTRKTCLKHVDANTIIDIRGDDPENCALFEEGAFKKGYMLH